MPRKSYAGAASATTLAAAINSSVATISVANAAGYPSSSDPFVIVIARGTSAEEKILIASVAGTTFTVASSGRGYDSTTAQSHSVGETVEHCIDSLTVDEANAHVNDDTRDDHSQYLNTTRHDSTARHSFGGAFGTPAAPPAVTTAASAGSASTPARSDHTHNIGTGAINSAGQFVAGVAAIGGALAAPAAPAAVSNTAAAGTATAAARADHVHAVGSGAVGAGLVVFGGAVGVVVDGVTVHVNGSNQLEVVAGSGTVSDGAISTVKIADAAVTTAKLAAGAVTTAILPAGTVIGMQSARVTPSTATSVSNTAYVNWLSAGAGGPLELVYTKKLASSDLIVRIEGSGFPVTAAGHLYTLGVRANGADSEVCRWFSNLSVSSPEHVHHGGTRSLSGIGAGAQTITARLKGDNTGTSGWSADNNDTWSITVTEVAN